MDVLGVSEGDLLQLTFGETVITAIWQSYTFFGHMAGQMLSIDDRIGDGYNVEKLVARGWTLRVLEKAGV
jgi:hypothetical protein